MKHIVNLSGGKDSTAMLIDRLEKGLPIDYIVFADTGKDFSQMLTHLDELEAFIIREYNAPRITRLKAEKSFDYLMFDHVKTKGKRIGTCGYGWATMLARWCTAQLKTDIINRFTRSLNDDYIHYVGIAGDEWERLIQKASFDMKTDIDKKTGKEIKRPLLDRAGCVQNLAYTQSNYRYPLAEQHINEKAALRFCYDRRFDWGGLYEHFDRVSCWCCPLKNLKELKTLYLHFPELWAELKDMDDRAYNQFRADYSVQQLEDKFIAEIKDAERRAAEPTLFNYLNSKEAKTT